MPKKYGALRTVATIYRILGWVVIVFGVLFSCGFLALTFTSGALSGGRVAGEAIFGGVFGFIGGLIWTALVGLGLLAFAEGIFVILDIEENTRAMSEAMKKPGA